MFDLELCSQLPLIPLWQGQGVLCEDVCEDEEELHVRKLCAGANSLSCAVRQKTFLVLDHLKKRDWVLIHFNTNQLIL